MLEQSNAKRVVFKKGEQTKFLSSVMNKLNISSREFASLVNISFRQFSDWKNEKSSIPLSALDQLIKISGLDFPANVKIIDRYAHTKLAGRKGGFATINQYGKIPVTERTRLAGWRRWWKRSGKDKVIKSSTKNFNLPTNSSALAEFTGIMMGDGGISTHQIGITLNKHDDYEYSLFIERIMFELFGVKPGRHDRKSKKAIDLKISRVALVKFCNKHLNLPIGDKLSQGLRVPAWIIDNREYTKDFLRGLFDTDGCVVIETHSIKGKLYSYLRLNWTTYCPILSQTIYEILTNLGFHPKKRRGGKAIQLENHAEICDYLEVIGTHNPKHSRRAGKFI